MRTKLRQRNSGITLIEVVVALAIAGVLTAAAIPAVNLALDRARTNTSTRALVAALKSTRQQARAAGDDALFTLDVASATYRIAGSPDRILPAPDSATLTLLTAESERLTQTAGGIRFFSDGSSTGGTITLTHRGREHRIEVDWLTGHVRTVTP